MKSSRSPHSLANRSPSVAVVVASAIIVVAGCFQTSRARQASAERRQAKAIEEREEELKFLDENGTMDWRGRIDAAKEKLAKAEANKRWGQNQTALEHALDAARLMPPDSKDFELPDFAADERPHSSSGSDSAAPRSNPSAGGKTEGSVDHGASDQSAADQTAGGQSTAGQSAPGGEPQQESRGEDAGDASESALDSAGDDDQPAVSNDEVKRLRKAINEILKDLDRSMGAPRSKLDLDSDPIEIQ